MADDGGNLGVHELLRDGADLDRLVVIFILNVMGWPPMVIFLSLACATASATPFSSSLPRCEIGR